MPRPSAAMWEDRLIFLGMFSQITSECLVERLKVIEVRDGQPESPWKCKSPDMKASRQTGRRAGGRARSVWGATSQLSEMQGRCFRKKSRRSVYVSSHGAAERWPLSRVTDYRSLMLPRRLPRQAEMNHPSAFFCKPSITPDFPAQTPTIRSRHTYLHARIRRGYSTESHGGISSADESTQTPWERRPPLKSCLLCSPLSSLSLPHITSPVISAAASFSFFLVTCSLLTFYPSLFIPASSQSQGSSPPHCALYHSGISVSCVSLGISLPSSTEQANHCWHFKSHWIKWPTVGWVCGSTICPMTSTSQ